MQANLASRIRPPRGGRLTLGTLILAAAAAASLVMLSGCHSTPPPGSGFVANDAEKAREARLLHPVDTMKPLQPFDEGFGVVADEL